MMTRRGPFELLEQPRSAPGGRDRRQIPRRRAGSATDQTAVVEEHRDERGWCVTERDDCAIKSA